MSSQVATIDQQRHEDLTLSLHHRRIPVQRVVQLARPDGWKLDLCVYDLPALRAAIALLEDV